MRVISTLNDKGGTGKTTVAVNLAGCLVEAGRSVLVLDLDAQAAAKQWADQEAPFPFPVEAIELEGARKFKQRLREAGATDTDIVAAVLLLELVARDELIGHRCDLTALGRRGEAA